MSGKKWFQEDLRPEGDAAEDAVEGGSVRPPWVTATSLREFP